VGIKIILTQSHQRWNIIRLPPDCLSKALFCLGGREGEAGGTEETAKDERASEKE